jgi:hypothetical protein
MHYKNEITPEMLTDLDVYVQSLYPNNTDEESLSVACEAAQLFVGYLKQYTNDPLKIVSSEVLFDVELPSCMLTGKVDALTRTQDGLLWRHEYKTAARVDSAYLQGLKGGLQGAIYDYAIERLFNEQLHGTIYDLIIKTKVPGYQRSYTIINRKAIDRMLVTVEGVAHDIQQGSFYPSSQCFGFNQECTYKLLCEHDSPETREAFYVKRE